MARPELVREASRAFGSSTIVVSIEAIQRSDGGFEAYTDFGRECTGVDAFEWACKAVDLGAGELMVTSIDREGTGKGFELELVRSIAEAVPVPVIACGGAGSIQHVQGVLEQGMADAVCLASILHYHYVTEHRDESGDYSSEGNTEFILSGRGFANIQGVALPEIKSRLAQQGIDCRWVP
jgi:cyclase